MCNDCREMTDKLKEDGFLDLGYTLVGIDDCWLSKTRSNDGRLQPDEKRFPSGMKKLGHYIHHRLASTRPEGCICPGTLVFPWQFYAHTVLAPQACWSIHPGLQIIIQAGCLRHRTSFCIDLTITPV